MKKKAPKKNVKAPKKAKAKTSAKLKKPKTKTKAKKISRRASAKVAAVPKPGVIAPKNGILLGYVEDYYAQIGVIALTLKKPLTVGQKIHVLGHTTNFEQPVDSMQIDHASVAKAGTGDGIGVKVIDRARSGDHVYLLK